MNNIEAQVLSIAKHHELTCLLVVELVWKKVGVLMNFVVPKGCRVGVLVCVGAVGSSRNGWFDVVGLGF